ncbi:MAG TPA: hypothetical protein VKT82_35145 [Ktedonobacterales bacterium]|nr:hypothetical protein [Ktedonobacterales bacterium]
MSNSSYRAAPVYKRRNYEVACSPDGSLLQVTPSEKLAQYSQRFDRGKRGKIRGFSRASRRRMLRAMASLKREEVARAKFVHLTYPSEYPTPAKAKDHLRAFIKRLRRQFEKAAVTWKIEPQKRGAPHFHLLILGPMRIDKHWLSRAWYEVVDSGDEKHLRAGTKIEVVRSYRGAVSYTSKYMAKVQEMEPDEAEAWGRWWGQEGDFMAYEAAVVLLDLDRHDMARLARCLDKLRLGQARASKATEKRRRELLRRAKRRRPWLTRSAYWFVDGPALWGRYDGMVGQRGIDAYLGSLYTDYLADQAEQRGQVWN